MWRQISRLFHLQEVFQSSFIIPGVLIQEFPGKLHFELSFGHQSLCNFLSRLNSCVLLHAVLVHIKVAILSRTILTPGETSARMIAAYGDRYIMQFQLHISPQKPDYNSKTGNVMEIKWIPKFWFCASPDFSLDGFPLPPRVANGINASTKVTTPMKNTFLHSLQWEAGWTGCSLVNEA